MCSVFFYPARLVLPEATPCSQKGFPMSVPHVPKRGSSGMSMFLMFPKEVPLACLCSSCSQKRFLWHVCVPHVPKRDSSGMSVFPMFPKEGSPCLVLTFFHVLFKAIYSHVPKRDSSGMTVFLMFPKRGFSMSGSCSFFLHHVFLSSIFFFWGRVEEDGGFGQLGHVNFFGLCGFCI